MNSIVEKKSLQLTNVIDGSLRQLELTATQHKQLEVAYNSVARWLADSNHPLLSNVSIYPQGSVRLRTTVRPLGKDEFDVDLVCFLPSANQHLHSADYIYELVGNRLKGHDVYKRMLEEKKRCWRLDYADGSRFHMDITPAMQNLNCGNSGILVPDRDRQELKPSNPIGYSDKFDDVSRLAPRFRSFDVTQLSKVLADASIEPLPNPMQSKDFLRRTVQLAKRHRDLYFQKHDGYPPISIILTTLAMESYGVHSSGVFDDPWHFLRTVMADMPRYVRKTVDGYEVTNPSTDGENFAEKWNETPQQALDFMQWHQQFLTDVDRLVAAQGLDQVSKILNERLVGSESIHWQKNMIGGVSNARVTGGLYREPHVGGISVVSGTPVQKNTFFGG
jgi:hypothetical protein